MKPELNQATREAFQQEIIRILHLAARHGLILQVSAQQRQEIVAELTESFANQQIPPIPLSLTVMAKTAQKQGNVFLPSLDKDWVKLLSAKDPEDLAQLKVAVDGLKADLIKLFPREAKLLAAEEEKWQHKHKNHGQAVNQPLLELLLAAITLQKLMNAEKDLGKKDDLITAPHPEPTQHLRDELMELMQRDDVKTNLAMVGTYRGIVNSAFMGSVDGNPFGMVDSNPEDTLDPLDELTKTAGYGAPNLSGEAEAPGQTMDDPSGPSRSTAPRPSPFSTGGVGG